MTNSKNVMTNDKRRMIGFSKQSSIFAKLLKGAGAILGQSQGVFMLYGPFQEGAKTAPSNLDFDASLKSRDARWGVRALDQLLVCAEKEGLGLSQRIEMPANNLMLKFKWARS